MKISAHSKRRILWHRLCLVILMGTLFTSANARPTQMPLSISYAAEPNIMILLGNARSMNSGSLDIAKNSINSAVDKIDNTRFCLASFKEGIQNPDGSTRVGSSIANETLCSGRTDTQITDFKDSVNSLTPISASDRPFASSFYDISRYFRGKRAYFGEWPNKPHPIQYRCQNNSVIVIGDDDDTFVDPFLLDWNAPVDHLNPAINILNDSLLFDISPPLIESHKSLQQLTARATEIDFVPVTGNDHAIGRANDHAEKSFNDDTGIPGFETQTIETHSIALQLNVAPLIVASEQGGGEYFEANTENRIFNAIETIVSNSSPNPERSGARITQSAVSREIIQLPDTAQTIQTSLYITQFDTNNWTGDLVKFELGSNSNPQWSAAHELDNRSAERKIFTSSASGATGFAHNGSLGDIVHSSATYVRNADFGYADADYAVFINDTNTDKPGGRPGVVYIGANDGMLHAFDADDGEEIFAYIPETVFEHLPSLASPNYRNNHQYFVDGEMSVVDARLDDNWSTVLASPLGAGFKGLFLLDVTNPDAPINDLYKWEINDGSTDYGAMGYMLNSPKIARVQIPNSNGSGFHEKWLLFVGNGVHSEDQTDVLNGQPIIGKASVFVIDLDNGRLISEIPLDSGEEDGSAKYTSFSEGNGVTSVALVDQNADTFVNHLYAADLKGNLWRINYEIETGEHTSTDAQYIDEHLSIAFRDADDNLAPLFTATGSIRNSNNSIRLAQAITSEITVTGPPRTSNDSQGELVFFGTGQFFDTVHMGDEINNHTQSMYALWDKGDTAIDKSDLSEQTISLTGDERVFDEIISYEANKRGWYIDLPEYGERIIQQPTSLFENISFVSQSPLNQNTDQGDFIFDPCLEGLSGWSMIARQDTAQAILSFGSADPDNPDAKPIAGKKLTAGNIKNSIFIESPDGKLISPVIDASDLDNVLVDETLEIQKEFFRGTWKRIQF